MEFATLKIKSLRAKNFLCFGDEEVHIDFTKLGNIILIRGRNMDIFASSEEERLSSNGTGKSAIADAIVYGLYGKTIKKPEKIGVDGAINNQNKKKLEVEVLVGDYRILRCRKPDSIQVWKSKEGVWDKDTKITLGGMPATNKFIEEEIIRMPYEAFLNLVVFTDNNSGMFLECTGPKKREVVESFLSLQRYVALCEDSKKKQKAALTKIKDAAKDVEVASNVYDGILSRIEKLNEEEVKWKAARKQELTTLLVKAKNKQAEMSSSDNGAAIATWEEAQEKIKTVSEAILEKQDKAEKIKAVLEEARKKDADYDTQGRTKKEEYLALNSQVNTINDNIKIHQNRINDVEARRCKFCKQTDEDIIDESKAAIVTQKAKLVELEPKMAEVQAEYNKISVNSAAIKAAIKTTDAKLSAINKELAAHQQALVECNKVVKPEISADEQVLREQLQEIKNQIISKKAEYEGDSPYVQIMESNLQEKASQELIKSEKEIALQEANEILPYYDFWVRGFGEDGIRKFILDDVIGPLNGQMNYWLQFLFDGKIKMEFDNTLDEKISRNPEDGDPFIYYAMSSGERRKLNLATSGGFAYITMLNSGVTASMIFLDEVATNVDPAGVLGIYKMILELSKEKQVIITTHDPGLLELLEGCETINLQKEGGFTTILNK